MLDRNHILLSMLYSSNTIPEVHSNEQYQLCMYLCAAHDNEHGINVGQDSRANITSRYMEHLSGRSENVEAIVHESEGKILLIQAC